MADERQMFDEWVGKHARGTLNADATAALASVVQAVTDLGKKGSLVVEIIIEPADQDGRVVAIGGKLTAKPPTPTPSLSIYYPDESGQLFRDDPYQRRIPGMTKVDAETGEIIDDGKDDA